MDTLSSSISNTFKAPSLHHHHSTTKSHVRNHLVHSTHFSISNNAQTRKTSATLQSNKAATFVIPPLLNNPSPKQPAGFIHRHHHKAASGYAVALLDIARCSNALQTVKTDVTRLSKCWLRLRSFMADPRVDSKDKAEITRQVLKQGRYHKHLVKLVKLLVEKDKVGILSDVLAEFGTIYDELKNRSKPNTQVVLVPADLKLQENQAMEIAERVQKLSGGVAKVVLRQLVDQSRYVLPSLAS